MTIDTTKIWESLRDSFEDYDGGLPEVYITNLTRDEVVGLYDYLTELAGIAADPKIYNVDGDKSWPLSELKDPVALVLDEKVQGFWVELKPFELGGGQLPNFHIGVFGDDCLILVYTTGPWWNEIRLISYFDFLIHLLARTQNGAVNEFPEFNTAFETYRTATADRSK